MPPNYQNGKIYCIRSHKTDQIYVGSTTETLCKRMTKHRDSYKRFLKGKGKYITSIKLLELCDAHIELIEKFPCNSREELNASEGFWIRKENCVNRCVAGRTMKEYREDNKEREIERHRKYREDNREKELRRKMKYYEDNREKYLERNKKIVRCSCGLMITYGCLSRHRKSHKHRQTLLNAFNLFNHL